MSIKWNIENNNWINFTVSGQLGKDEYDQILVEIKSIIQKEGDIYVLVFLENFTGWEPNKAWEETSFAAQLDPFIKKFAIIGDEEWRDLVTAFTLKGLRPVPIEYFLPYQLTDALQWLTKG